jgi:acetoin utilization protein AcuB
MTIRPFTVASTASLATGLRTLQKHQIRHLPVVDDERIVGLLLESDLRVLELLGRADLDTTQVDRIMRREPYIVAEQTGLAEVVETMAARKLDVAIVADGAEIRGIFTAVDACEALSLLLHRAA